MKKNDPLTIRKITAKATGLPVWERLNYEVIEAF